MKARRKRAAKRPQSRSAETVANPDSPVPSSRQKVAKLASTALDECVAVVSMIEVTMRSLELQEIASPEQEVLRRALGAIWLVHDWIYESQLCEEDAS